MLGKLFMGNVSLIGGDSSLEMGQPFSQKIRDGAVLFAGTAVVHTGVSDTMPHINHIF